ncbi:MAG TPA: ABC transporter permease [Methanomicrobiales archaeon]|jgi:lipooligosaccharide transport system permease protein|nr:ABC transporter permease [Methanomicrobiales archaeon]
MSRIAYLQPPTLTRRTLRVWQRNWDVFVRTFRINFLPPLLEPLLYLLSLGYGLGIFITQIDGVSYPRFIAPALLAVSIMNAGFFETTYSSYVRMYFQKTFDAIIATPLSIEEVITGEILWGATRSFINASIMLPVLVIFGVVDLPISLVIIPFAFLAGFLFASIGMFFTALTPNIETLNLPTFLFVTPMFLFSGTFFPLSILPVPMQIFANAVLPLTHVVKITRMITLSQVTPGILVSLAWIVIVAALFFVLAVNLMKKRLIV